MQELFKQISDAWNSLAPRQRLSLAVSAAFTVAAIGGIVWWANQPSWSVLYTGLDAKEAQSIVQELQTRGVPHRMQGGGAVLEVPIESVDRLRMELAAKDLPGSGRFGFLEMFSQDTIAHSNRMQRVRYQKALEDELARTIESLDEVRSARVHLALPGDRVFVDDDDAAKGSVTLGLAGGRSLTSQQVQAIARIVAGAAPDLTPAWVSVVDTMGRVLWEGEGENGSVTSGRQVEFQAGIERDMNSKVARVLEPILGAEGFVVRTTADLEFQRILRREKQIDPDSGVLISETKRKSKSEFGDSEAGGIPGAGSNLPGAAGGGGGFSGEQSETSDTTSNFEYSIVNSTVEEPTGSVKKLSVAVLVDQDWEEVAGDQGGAAERRAVPRSAEEMARIEQLVKAAISFDEGRGDIVQVEQAPFMPLVEPEIETAFDPTVYLPFVKYPALVVLALLAFVLFYRPLIKTLKTAFADGASRRGAGPAGIGVASIDGPPQLGPPSNLEMLRQSLAHVANEHPAGMAQTLRLWLHEEARSE